MKLDRPDIKNLDETARRERSAYTRIMNAMLTLEEPSRMKVLGAIAIMIKPALQAPPASEPAPGSEPPT